jgi:integrase
VPAVKSRPIISATDARALLTVTRGDRLFHAGVSLLLYAGLRRSEVSALLISDYMPGAEPRLRVGAGSGMAVRTIRIARSAAAALDAYLAGEDTAPDEPLLMGLQRRDWGRHVRHVAEETGVRITVHDLRRAAIAAALAGGASALHLEVYFGLSKLPGRRDLLPVSERYDAAIAEALERAFA